jgi:hypothetical protein
MSFVLNVGSKYIFPLLPGQAEKDKIADFFLAAFGLAWRRAVAISPYPKKRL